METKSGSYSFVILLSLYLCMHALQLRAIGPEWVRFYGKDLIIAPLILLGITRIQAIINKTIEVRKKEIIVLVVYLVLAFEVIVPALKPSISTDIWDALMYSIGALVYYLLMHKKTEPVGLKKTLN